MNASDLIGPKEALEILPFVSYYGLLTGAKGTNVLARHRAGTRTLYSRTECRKLADKVLNGRRRHYEPERPYPGRIV